MYYIRMNGGDILLNLYKYNNQLVLLRGAIAP